MSLDGQTVCLSLAFNWHDSNCAVSVGSEIVNSLELERLFRCKHMCASLSRMALAASYLLERSNLSIDQVDYLVVNALNNPFQEQRHTQDVVPTRYRFLGREMASFVVRHHMAHAGYYYLSPFDRALVSSCDGGGDLGERVAFFVGHGTELTRLHCDVSGHTSALPYAQVSSFLYGAPFSEGKLMALAAYGAPSEMQRQVDRLFLDLRDVSIRRARPVLAETFDGFEFSARNGARVAKNLAFAVQETFVRRRCEDVKGVYGAGSYGGLVIVGGSALNLGCNTQVFHSITDNTFTPPCCDDSGIAVGQLAVVIAAVTGRRPRCELPYVGVDEPAAERHLYLSKAAASCDVVHDARAAAGRIAAGDVCLAHIGRPEVGPRALGHRSFLVSPSRKMKQVISCDVKQREPYRPVAPIVLEEELDTFYTDGPERSPFMLHSFKATAAAYERAPGTIHVDGTARAQTVSRNDAALSALLDEYRRITGSSVLINTSLNLSGEPLSSGTFDTLRVSLGIRASAFIFAT